MHLSAAVDFYWIPLGAGGHSVRFNGVVYEAVDAALHRRPRCALYHSALVVTVDGASHTIELAPVWNERAPDRGVVAEGAVGSRFLGRSKWFRYELRCWRDGWIPDLAEAVDSPRRLTSDPACARRILELAPTVPTPVWGRDELGLGEMWNCNSVISWLLARTGVDVQRLELPPGGRAPGWDAGLALAGPRPDPPERDGYVDVHEEAAARRRAGRGRRHRTRRFRRRAGEGLRPLGPR